MRVARKIFFICREILEIVLPIVLFIGLFILFITGVIFRYLFRNPQTWAFELSTISFVMLVLLAGCTAQRKEDHVVFDLVYERLNPKGQNIFRIVGNIIMVVLLLIGIPSTVKTLWSMRLVVTQVVFLPYMVVFSPLAILFIVAIIRYSYRLVQDIRAFKSKTYVQQYNTSEKEMLI
ncbi:MAG: TRAP transporter small permease [Acetivibrionales bacterium]|jgi:TRAP-type C4-dicarboxylate transport system permease small subunit